jgi:DNA replication protein DnaC
MSTHAVTLEIATIGQQCKVLHLPAVAAQCAQLAEQAVRERRTHLGYLEALLQARNSRNGSSAYRQKRRVRFATAAAMIDELVEAKHQLQLGRALARWARYDLIALDEVGYVPLAEVGAEFLFQVIAERAEKAAVIVTTNLPFSEWTQVVPNPRPCKALLDRITDRAHIIETGTESYRFRRTLEKRKGQSAEANSTTAPPPLTAGAGKKGT